ncbi:MAG: hypothetical protein ACREIA_20845 [Opitutaceae bacterium]
MRFSRNPPLRATEQQRRATRLCSIGHCCAAAGFALSLLAGAWSGWLGRGFQAFAWCIVIPAMLLLAVVIAGFIDQMCRALRAARLRRSRGVRFRLLGLVIVTVGTVIWTIPRRAAPSENLLGNHDQGMYLGAAVHLARTGQFRIDLSELDRCPPEAKSLLLRRDPVQFTRGDEEDREALAGISLGFPLADQTTPSGPAVPHFPAGAATFFGAGFAVGGWPWMQMMNWWAVVLGILSLGWMAARRLGAVVGLIVVLLLILHPLTAWAANRHYAEPLLFALWATGLCLLGFAARGRFVAGLAAGLVFSAAACVKFDALFIVVAAPAALFFARIDRAAMMGLISGGMAGFAAAGILISLQSGAYLMGNLRALWSNSAIVAGVIVTAIATSVVIWLRMTGRIRSLRRIWRVLVVGAALAALCLYLFRADPPFPDTYFHAGLGREIRSFREDTLRRLDWYWMPLGLLPALAGACVLSRRYRAPEIAALVIAGYATLAAFGHDLFCDPVQPYAMRRLAVYTIPFLLLGTACLIHLRRPRWIGYAALLLIGGQAAGEMLAHRRLNDVPEYAGTRDFCERLIAHIPPNAVVLVADRSVFSSLAMVVRAAGDREVWIVQFDKTDAARIAPLKDMVARWMKQGKRVMILGGDGLENSLRPCTSIIIARERWQTRWQPRSPDRLDPAVRELDAICYIRELLPSADRARNP